MKAASTKDVQLKIHNLRTFVKSDNERVHGLLYGKLALFDKSAVYSPAYKVTWDGMVRFYYKATQSFNTGLLSWAYKILKNEGFKVSFIDCRKPPDSCVDDEIPLQITLRDYQQDIVDQCVKCTRGIINAATGCLSGDTIIPINRCGKGFQILLRDLENRFNGGPIKYGHTKSNAFKRWDLKTATYARSNFDGIIIKNKIRRVYKSGIRTTYEVKTANNSIRATVDHKFLTADGWKRLADLAVGDDVFVNSGKNNCLIKKRKLTYRYRCGLLNHPFTTRKNCKRTRNNYAVPFHRLVVEAHMNNMDVDSYIAILRKGADTRIVLNFLNPCHVVHHKDGNTLNNDFNNLQVLPSNAQHSKNHGYYNNWKHVADKIGLEKIESITLFGEEETYDIEMENSNIPNFIANNFVVHNSGKTECFIALIAKLRVPTIVIVDNVDLILQTSARIEACGIPVNRIMGGRFPKSDKWVHVGTYQTLRKQKKELAKHKFGLKVADECHGVAAGTWFDVMNAIPTYYSFGFSGTVDWRMEDPVRYARIMSMTGKQLVHVSSEYLVSIGILAKPNINMLYYDCKMPKTDYPTEYDIVIVKSKMLNERIVPTIVKKHENAKILILVNRIEHGKYLSDLLNYSFVSGSDSASTREKMLDDFKKGIITKLIASKIFKQGIDIPDVEVIITLGSDDSYKAVFQKLGRGLRKADGKNELHYYDVFPRSGGYAERHAKNRRKKYEYAGFDVNIIKDYTK